MDAKTRLEPGKRYDWSMTVRMHNTAQDHWGHIIGSGQTVAEVMEAVRVNCAQQMKAPVRSVEVVVFKFNGPA